MVVSSIIVLALLYKNCNVTPLTIVQLVLMILPSSALAITLIVPDEILANACSIEPK